MESKEFSSISKRIKWGYLIILALLLLLTATSLFLSMQFNKQYTSTLDSFTSVNDMQDMYNKDYEDLKNILNREETKYDRKEFAAKTKSKLNNLVSIIPKGEIEISQKLDVIQRLSDQYSEMVIMFISPEKMKEDPYAVALKYQKAGEIKNSVIREIKELTVLQLTYSQKIIQKIKNQFKTMFILCTIFAGVIIVGVFIFSFRISKSISDSLGKLTGASKKVGEGDLTIKDIQIDTNDEFAVLAYSFNKMKNNLREIAKRISEIGYSIYLNSKDLNENIYLNAEISSQISIAVGDVACGAESQSNGLIRSSNSIEEIYKLANDLRESLNIIKLTNPEEKIVLEKANTKLKTLISGIEEINSVSKELSDLSTRYASNSEEIAASTEEQVSNFKRMLETSNSLNKNAEELDHLTKNLKTVE